MKLLRSWVAGLVVALVAGCANDPDRELGREMGRITPVEPPPFLNADVAQLFGQANFSARVEVQKGFPGSQPPMVGELSGRDGNLFFIADQQRSNRGFSGGLSALWDAPTQTAYLLNEPLQAYAPIRHSGTNGPTEITQAGEENIGAERCRKSILSRRNGADLIPVLVVWRGIAEQDLPLRIQTTNTPGAVTLNLSRIRPQAPPADLFALPNGFKKFDSADAMLSELMRRRTDLISARNKRNRDKYGAPRGEDEAMPDKLDRPY